MPEKWLTKRDLAAHLAISVRSVDRMIAAGCPHAIIYQRAKFHASSVEVWLESCGRLERRGRLAATQHEEAMA